MAVTQERLEQIEAELADLYKKKSGSNEVNKNYGISNDTPNKQPSEFLTIQFTNLDPSGTWTGCIVNGEEDKKFNLDREAFESLITAMQENISIITGNYQTQITALENEKNAE